MASNEKIAGQVHDVERAIGGTTNDVYGELIDQFGEETINRVVSLRPTLFLGLGGQGTAIVSALKAELGDAYRSRAGGIPTCFQFLAIDTWPYQPGALEHAEYENVGSIDGDALLSNDPDRIFARWWPDPKIRAGYIGTGADAKRICGRLGLLAPKHFNAWTQKLKNRLVRMATQDDDLAGTGSKTVKVFLVSSACGGSGSGMLLDVAHIAKDLIRRHSVTEKVSISAVLILPDVFAGAVHGPQYQQVQGNTFATLTELENLNYPTRDIAKISYGTPEFSDVQWDPNPFEITYLIRAQNEAGIQVVRRPEEMVDRIAKMLFVHVNTPPDASGANAFGGENVSILGSLDKKERSRSYSSFGISSLVYPSRLVLLALGSRAASEAIGKLVNDTADLTQITTNVETWLSSEGLRELGTDQVVEQIDRDENDRPFRVDFSLLDYQKDFDRDSLVDSVKREIEDLDNKLSQIVGSEDSPFACIAKRRLELTNQKIETIDSKIESVVSQRGTAQGHQYADHLVVALAQDSADVQQDIQRETADLVEFENTVKAARDSIAEALQEGFFTRGRAVRTAIGDLQSALESWMLTRVRLKVYQAVSAFYGRLLERVRSKAEVLQRGLQTLEGLQVTLNRSYEKAHREIVRQASLKHCGTALSVVGPEYLTHVYEKTLAPELSNITQTLDAAIDFENIEAVDESELSNTVFSLAAHPFLKLAKQGIGTILPELLADESREDQVKQMLASAHSLAAPLLHVPAAMDDGGFEETIAYGVPVGIKKDEAFKNQLTKMNPDGHVAPTWYHHGDKDSIIIARTKHGYALWWLTQMQVWGRAYEVTQKSENGLPLHIGGMNLTRSIFALDIGDKAVRLFALGEAFAHLFPEDQEKYIFRKGSGTHYYMIEETRSGSEKHKLGNGLAEALESFSENADLQDIINKRVNEKIDDELGRIAAASALEPFKAFLENRKRKAIDQKDDERKQITEKMHLAIVDTIQDLSG